MNATPASAREVTEAFRTELGPAPPRWSWRAWAGVNGMFYAWLPGSSPPAVLRSATIPGLAHQVSAWEAAAQ